MALRIIFRPGEGVTFNGTAFRIGKPPTTTTAVLERDGSTVLVTDAAPVEVLPGVTVILAGRIGPDAIPLAFEAPRDCLILRVSQRAMAGEIR